MRPISLIFWLAAAAVIAAAGTAQAHITPPVVYLSDREAVLSMTAGAKKHYVREVKLTPREYGLLRVLITHAGKVITHQQLLRHVWGPASVRETHYLRVYIAQLRQKIERDPARPCYILTEPGVGYRLHMLDED